MTSWIYRMSARIGALFQKSRLDRELKEELAAHIDLATEENIRRGMDPAAARRQALREFGSRDSAMELHRQTRGLPVLENFIQDVRHAISVLTRRPLLLATTTLSIAIGVGLNVAVYSVLQRVLFDAEIAVGEPEGVVNIGPGFSYPNYEDLRDSGAVANLAARQTSSLTWRNGDATSTASARVVSANFFDVIGVRPLYGEAFGSQNMAGGIDMAGRVVVAYEFWQQRLGGSRATIGQTLSLNGWPYVVVGVLSKGFYSMVGPMVTADVYVPISERVATALNDCRAAQFDLIGRQSNAMTREQTLAALRVAAQRLESQFPEANRGLGRNLTVSPVGAMTMLVSPQVRRAVLTAAAALYLLAGLVLLTACMNVAGMLAARAIERGSEISIRMALGATRGRIIQQLLAESLVIAALGCAAGAALWIAGATAIPNMAVLADAGMHVAPGPLPFLYCLALTILVTVCCGLAPAVTANHIQPGVGLKPRQAGFQIRRWTLGRSLVAGQVAVCFVLLTGASVLLVSLLRQQVTDPGFDVAHTISIQMRLPTAAQGPQALPRSFTGLGSMVETLPGVESVTCVRFPPLAFLPVSARVHHADSNRDGAFTADLYPVGPQYFETMGIPLDRGRDFNDEDLRLASANETAGVINRTFAERYFRETDPIGRRLVIEEREIGQDRVVRIVGVARDSKLRSLNEDRHPVFYVPEASRSLIVRVSGGTGVAARTLERMFADREPGAVVTVSPMESQLALALRPARMGAAVLLALGGIGVVLAMIGLQGIIAYTVARRTFEIGIRVALGATRTAIMRMVFSDTFLVLGVGSFAGSLLSFALVGALRPLLAADQRLTNPLPLLGVLTLLLIAGLAVSLRPARRAAKVDPMTALRKE